MQPFTDQYANRAACGHSRKKCGLDKHHITRFLLISACYLGVAPVVRDSGDGVVVGSEIYLRARARS